MARLSLIRVRARGAGAALALILIVIASTSAVGAAAQALDAVRGAASAPSPAAATHSRETDLVAAVAARLGARPVVRAQFRQTQTLAAMTRPLISTGSLLFVRERGAIWRVDAPRRAVYAIGDAGVSEYDGDGRGVPRSTRSAGGVAQVSKVMRAMLGGDLSALYSQFDVSASGSPQRWRLQLKPNQPQLAQAIDALTLEGGEFVQTIEIASRGGDLTRIDFSGSTALQGPTPHELALLGARP